MLDLLAFSLILLPHACAKLHRVPMAPAGYHWRKLPLAEEDQPQAPGLPVPPPASPSASRLDSWASSWYRFRLPARTPPLVMWCPFTLSWYSAIHSCTCHLLPTGEYQTEWAEGNGLLPYSWLLRPPGYAVFPASYPPADCMICREIGRFGLVRDDCPLHDPFPWDWQVWPGRGRE
ncbi:hypothetical protein F5144DRAFT_566779 [Chaetomium tenue]|uniref:Uncharacterized protein n=1 Tax=Chaetomium tenue TaxID=1854479 RepID=A0ACB7PBE6_9PEZI|nr:hypothetical protein F5144DRAFT_566779 [Chaetomium globosum]